MLRKLLRFLTGRLFISLVLIVVQLATLFLVLFYVQNNAVWFQILSGLSIVMTLVVVVRDLNPAYKIGWMLLFMFFPVYGESSISSSATAGSIAACATASSS